MVKKAIAAFLLVSMFAWSEVALAPLLAMHAGHMRSGHEMTADMPSNHAHLHSAHQSEKAPGLPCCPGFHKAEPRPVVVILAGAPSCDDPHSCCFRQGPQNVPAPLREARRLSREIAPAMLVASIVMREAARIAPHDSTHELSPPADVFGMTLRI